MDSQRVWLAFLAISALLVVSNGQACMSGCDLNFTGCMNIDYPVLVYPNIQTVQAYEDAALKLLKTIYSPLYNLPKRCTDVLSLFVCNQYHPSCDNSNSSDIKAMPIKPCKQLCVDVIAACGLKTLAQAPDLIPFLNCSDPKKYSQDNTVCSHLKTHEPQCGPNKKPPLMWSGACQQFDPKQSPLSGVVCEAYAPKTIWVPLDWPNVQAIQDSSANVQETARRIAQAGPVVPLDCYRMVVAVLCPIIYPPCVMVDVPEYGERVAVGPPICHSFCVESMDMCKEFFDYANFTAILPACNNPNMTERYTKGSTHNITIDPTNNFTVSVSCINQMFPDDAYTAWTIPKNYTCPAETGRKTKVTMDEPLCGLQCPDASYSMAEWRKLVRLTQAGSAISLVCMLFLIVSYLVKYEKRKFPATFHINQFVATSMFSIAFLLGGAHPEKNVWCYDEGTSATQSNVTMCGVQGFFFIFFGIAIAAWCAVIAFTMFYSIVLNRTKNSIGGLQKYHIFFYLFGWAMPLAFGIGALAAKKIGYGPPLAWCFIQFEGVGYGGVFSKDYILFYIPIGVLFVSILVMFIATLATIAATYRSQNISSDTTIFVTAQIRVFIFIFVILCIVFTIFEWRFQIEAENNKANLSVVGIHWTYCKIKKALGWSIKDSGVCDGNRNPARIDYAHTAFESFLLSGIGVLIFIAFASDVQIYQHWAKIFKLLKFKEFDYLLALIIVGKEVPKNSKYNSATNTNTHKSSGSKGTNATSSNTYSGGNDLEGKSTSPGSSVSSRGDMSSKEVIADFQVTRDSRDSGTDSTN